MPKISVCVPVYNVEESIARCVESIQSQSLTDIEIIIVNDCTQDKSMEVVMKYAKTDNRIKILEHDVNRGLMMARKTGYMASVGDYITFLDSDDTFPVGSLEALYSAAINENADIVSGTIQYIPNEGQSYLLSNKMQYGTDKISVYKSLLKNECGHNLCSRIFRRELLQDHIYQTFEGATNGEDGILFYQVVNNAEKIIPIENVVYEYHCNPLSSSKVKYGDTALKSIMILNSMRIRTAGQYPELKKLVIQKISEVLFSLKINGYNIKEYVVERGLEYYCRVSTLIEALGVIKVVELYLKLLYYKVR
jgi:glycosyltransferase involved in cell wall biosynthesis